jgi:hypothetical protein
VDWVRLIIAAYLIFPAACSSSHLSSKSQFDFGCPVEINLDHLPALGDRLPELPETRCDVMTSSGSIDPSYDTTIDGIEYCVAVRTQDSAVRWISTHSQAFSTPDGAQIGDQFGLLPESVAGVAVSEAGWGDFVCFPSGWCAYLSNCGIDSESFQYSCEPISGTTTISFFFKRLGLQP